MWSSSIMVPSAKVLSEGFAAGSAHGVHGSWLPAGPCRDKGLAAQLLRQWVRCYLPGCNDEAWPPEPPPSYHQHG